MSIFKNDSQTHRGLQRAISVFAILIPICCLLIGALTFYGLYCLFSLTELGNWWLVAVYSLVAIGGVSILSLIVLSIIYLVKCRKAKKE